MIRYRALESILDGMRYLAIAALWLFITIKLWKIFWLWSLLWAIPGYIILLNVVGFATLPIYGLVAWTVGPRINEAIQEMVEDEKSKGKQ